MKLEDAAKVLVSAINTKRVEEDFTAADLLRPVSFMDVLYVLWVFGLLGEKKKGDT